MVVEARRQVGMGGDNFSRLESGFGFFDFSWVGLWIMDQQIFTMGLVQFQIFFFEKSYQF